MRPFVLVEYQSLALQFPFDLGVEIEVLRFHLDALVVIKVLETVSRRRGLRGNGVFVFSQHEIDELIGLFPA